jgi:hypothetical protein
MFLAGIIGVIPSLAFVEYIEPNLEDLQLLYLWQHAIFGAYMTVCSPGPVGWERRIDSTGDGAMRMGASCA